MNIKKWVPWNWFKKEEEDAGKMVPVKRENVKEQGGVPAHPLQQFHHEIDRLFDQAFRGFGLSPFGFDQPLFPRLADGTLKPTLDLGATDKEYTITVEIPGVDEKDVKLEIINDTLTISGEKKQERRRRKRTITGWSAPTVRSSGCFPFPRTRIRTRSTPPLKKAC